MVKAKVIEILTLLHGYLKEAFPEVFKPSNEEGKKLLEKVTRWALRYQQNSNINQVVELFSSEPRIGATFSEFDNRKVGNYFPVNNGVIDLKTGKLFDYTPEMRISRRAGIHDQYDGIDYEPNATCPKWEEFIHQITCGDSSLALFIQRLLGYVLSAGNPERKVFTLYGDGRNGKSTLLKVVTNITGRTSDNGFARQRPITTFTKKQFESNGEEFSNAMKARLAVASESGEDKSLDEALIKTITGDEEVAYRKLYVGTVTATADFTIMIATNHPLKFSATDQAMVDRVVQVPFDFRIAADEVNKNLTSELLEEREGILTWLVNGAVDSATKGLGTCDAVERATKAYLKENNSVATFADECVKRSDSSHERVQAKTMHDCYVHFCKERNISWLSLKCFGKNFEKIGYTKQVVSGRTLWFNVKLERG